MTLNLNSYKSNVENSKLRKNKARYKRLKAAVFEHESTLNLTYSKLNKEELLKIREDIMKEVNETRAKKIKLSIFGILIGLIIVVWMYSIFNNYTF